MQPRYEGPFLIVGVTRGGSYQLMDRTNELLGRSYAPSQLKIVQQNSVEPDSESFSVQSVVDHKEVDGVDHYLVRWRGFSATDDSWEPVTNFDDLDVIRKFWQRRSAGSTDSSI